MRLPPPVRADYYDETGDPELAVEAARLRVVEWPDSDDYRLAYADALRATSREVRCRGCGGTGKVSYPVQGPDRGASTFVSFECRVCYGFGRVVDARGWRAELVRVQVEAARLEEQGIHQGQNCNVTGTCSECVREVEHGFAEAVAAKLLREHGRPWCDDLAGPDFNADSRARQPYPVVLVQFTCPCFSTGNVGVWFRRGFPRRVAAAYDDWAVIGDAAVAAAPVEEVELRAWTTAYWEWSGRPRFYDPPTALRAEETLRARWPSVRRWILPETR